MPPLRWHGIAGVAATHLLPGGLLVPVVFKVCSAPASSLQQACRRESAFLEVEPSKEAHNLSNAGTTRTAARDPEVFPETHHLPIVKNA